VPLSWQPIESLSRDDQNWRRVSEDDDSDSDVIPLGFPSRMIHGYSSMVLQIQPQIVCRPTHLYVPASLSESFNIKDFRIWNRSQLMSPNPLPASWFSSGRGSPIRCAETITPGLFVSLEVSNKTPQNRAFEAVLRCRAAWDDPGPVRAAAALDLENAVKLLDMPRWNGPSG
jgi:hypothetical protein